MFTVETITSVKRSLDANDQYIVNGAYVIPENSRFYRMIQEWLASDPENEIIEPTGQEIADRQAEEAAQAEKELVKKAIAAGQDLIVEAMVILKGQNVDANQATVNAQVFAPVQQLLQTGSLQTARDVFSVIDLSSTSLGESDRTSLLAKIDAYLT